MSDAAMWALIVGFASATFVLPVIQRPTWAAGTRAAVTFGYSVIVGLGTVYFTGGLDRTDLRHPRETLAAILLVLVSAIATYKGFALPTGIAPAIEAATSPRATRRARRN